MKLLKVGAAVVGLHVIGFILVFVYPGCRSTPRSEQANAGGEENVLTPANEAPTAETTLPPAEPEGNLLEASPIPVPGGAADTEVVRLPPTRPTPEQLAETPPPAPTASRTIDYTVAKGDTLSKISKATGATIDEILNANGLKRTSTLRVGQVLKIPGGAGPVAPTSGGTKSSSTATRTETYTVAAGDSLYTIARKLGSTVAAIKSANKLPNDNLKIGQKLTVPIGAPGASAPTPSAAVPEPRAPVTQGLSAPRGTANGTTHTVASGETLGSIARRYGVNAADIMRVNGISDTRKLRIGTQLVIPGAASQPSTVRTPTPKDAATTSSAPVSAPPAATEPASNPLFLPAAPSEATPTDASTILPAAVEDAPMVPVTEEPKP